MSEDDEFPRHGLGDDEKQLALSEADKAFNAMMCLLEHNRFEESSSPPRGSVGIAVRFPAGPRVRLKLTRP